MKFPKKLYVKKDSDPHFEDEWWVAREDYSDLADWGEPVNVGVYQLVAETQVEAIVKIHDDQNV